jgi:hypothetical protein
LAIKVCINRVNGVIGVNIIFHADYDKFNLGAKWDAQTINSPRLKSGAIDRSNSFCIKGVKIYFCRTEDFKIKLLSWVHLSSATWLKH